jgi:O-antigen/teichoic acid export membrane protein
MTGGVDIREVRGQGMLGAAELRRRAMVGVLLVAGRGIAVRLVAFLGMIVLARLLTPRDFGLFAVATAVLAVAQLLSDGGLGVGLLRRPCPPTREELAALLGLQLTLGLALCAAGWLVAPWTGRGGQLIALMLTALPVLAFRTPAKIELERDLQYRPLMSVEVAEMATFNVWAITCVALGLGVTGLASAALARALVGTAVLTRLSPLGWLRPRFGLAAIRPLLVTGVRFQAVALTTPARDIGLTAIIAALAGTATLGTWSLAYRILQVPSLLFESGWRVGIPAIARLIAAGEQPRAMVERIASVVAVGTGIVVAGLAGSSPVLVPAVFGDTWRPAADVMLPACLGLLVGGPISVATAGYLCAIDEVRIILRAGILHTIVWLAVAAALLPVMGIAAVGVGWLAAAVVDAVVLGHGVASRVGARLGGAIVTPVAVSATTATVSWELAGTLEADLLTGCAVAIGSIAVFLALQALIERAALVSAARLARSSVQREPITVAVKAS